MAKKPLSKKLLKLKKSDPKKFFLQTRTLGQSVAGHAGGAFAKAQAEKKDTAAEREASGQSAEDLIRKQWQGLISGKISSFTDERAAALKQELIENARGRERQELDASDVDLIRRGIYRSGIAARSARDIRRGTNRDIGIGEREIKLKQITAEFTDRMAGLQMAQAWLTSKRNYELGKESNEIRRAAIAASTALGYARIKSSEKIAARNAGIAAGNLGLARESFEFNKGEAIANREIRTMSLAFDMASRL